MTKGPDLEEQMKRAIEAAGFSRYVLAKRSGVSEGVLSNFMTGRRTITLETAAKLADVLEIELRPVKQARKDR